MDWFKKTRFSKTAELDEKEYNKRKEQQEKLDDESWIWIDGYMATEIDMTYLDLSLKCELHKQYNAKDVEFSLCKELKEVFAWNELDGKNRFFKVKALVRSADYNNYYCKKSSYDVYLPYHSPSLRRIFAKSVILEEEVTYSNGLKDYIHNKFEFIENEQEYEQLKYELYPSLRERKFIAELRSVGYSELFSNILYKEKANSASVMNEDKVLKKTFDKARSFKEEGISKEMSIYLLLKS